jgi:hypothetical protein
LHQTTCINTPEQNDISERKNRHLLEVTRSLLFQNNVPKTYWSDAVLTATYLINRLPTARLKNMSPLEILKGRKIDLDHIRVFGCTCFVHIKRHDKLDKNSVKTIFLGYSSEKKGYKCYDPKKFKVYFSRDVSFFEIKPYYETNEQINLPSPPIVLPPNNFVFPEETTEVQVITEDQDGETTSIHQHGETTAISSGGENEKNELSEESIQEEIDVRRSIRQTKPSVRLRDYVSHQVMYPIQDYISYKKVSPEYRAYLGNITHQTEPTTFNEAKQNPVWHKAMK